MSQKILVIGATGMLGEPVARRLQAEGYLVRILTRSLEKARARFKDEFEIASGDVEDSSSLADALQGCQGVHISLQGGLDFDLERRGAENTVRAAVKSGVQRITYISGASVCEENCWYEGTKAKYQAEAAIRASGISYTIFRANYFMETLHNLVRGKMALLIGKHPNPYTWVAAADYARMVSKAYSVSGTANKILYVCGPEALTMRQALQTSCHIAHPEARIVYLPIGLASVIAKLGGREQLQAVLPFLRYCEQMTYHESPAEANELLGAPTITLEMWSRLQVSG